MNEVSWSWAIALVVCFAALAVAESRAPHIESKAAFTTDRRLFTNFAMGIAWTGVSGALPISTLGAAMLAHSAGIGLCQLVALPWAAAFGLLLVARSFGNYWVHRAAHTIPAIWRVHRVHHADAAIDVSTALRNHPLELLIVAPVSALVVLLIGAPITVGLAVDTVLFAAVLWHHADLALPPRLERALQPVFVTPAFHRAHHAPDLAVHDNNYSDFLPIWDRLFGTLAPAAGRAAPVGLGRANADQWLAQLVDPLRREPSTTPLQPASPSRRI